MIMPQYTVEELEQLARQQQSGQGGRDAQERSYPEHVKACHPPPPLPAPRDIGREIYSVVYYANDWIDRAGIAKALNVKVSAWLIGHIEKLVDEGNLIRGEVPYRPGMTKKWYRINS